MSSTEVLLSGRAGSYPQRAIAADFPRSNRIANLRTFGYATYAIPMALKNVFSINIMAIPIWRTSGLCNLETGRVYFGKFPTQKNVRLEMVWIPQAFATICHANEVWWAQILRQGHIITVGFFIYKIKALKWLQLGIS